MRTVFCLFADDTGIFEPRDIFLQFIEERTAPDGADLGAWLMQLFEVLNTPLNRRQRALDEDLAGFPARQWGAVRRPAPAAGLRRGDAVGAARRGAVRLDGDLAGHLRGAISVRHGAGRAPRQRGALHDREEHPEGHRAAVPRRPAGRVPALAGSSGRPRRGRSPEVPGQARDATALRSGVRLRQLPDHRLPRASDAGDRRTAGDRFQGYSHTTRARRPVGRRG